MRKKLVTGVTCGLLVLCCTSTAQATTITVGEGKDYKTMGFAGNESFREIREVLEQKAVDEALNDPVWIIKDGDEWYFSSSREKNSLKEEYISTVGAKERIEIGTLLDVQKGNDLAIELNNDPEGVRKLLAPMTDQEPVNVPEPVFWNIEEVTDNKCLLEVTVGKYKIEEGDCLSMIAQEYGTSVKQLLSDNPSITNADLIYAGNYLVVR